MKREYEVTLWAEAFQHATMLEKIYLKNGNTINTPEVFMRRSDGRSEFSYYAPVALCGLPMDQVVGIYLDFASDCACEALRELVERGAELAQSHVKRGES
ncbi:hypothetical protein HNR62_001060 [Oceanisphaera litoralis]|nr:hypothetical protein [Oceanisphaera litoralis]